MLLFRRIEKLRYDPAEKCTVPPPVAAAASMALLIAAVSTVLPSPFAPKALTSYTPLCEYCPLTTRTESAIAPRTVTVLLMRAVSPIVMCALYHTMRRYFTSNTFLTEDNRVLHLTGPVKHGLNAEPCYPVENSANPFSRPQRHRFCRVSSLSMPPPSIESVCSPQLQDTFASNR